jgi:prepilin peptidase dependent protein B
MKRYPNPSQRGFSLVELLIGLAIGMIVLAGLTVLFIANLRSSSDMVASARLNQDLSALMTIMVNDVRRAGFAGGDATLYGGAFGSNADLNIVEDDGRACILLSYDRSRNATLEDNEFGGFRLNADGSVSMRSSCTPADPADETDACYTDCTNGDWERLTDPGVIRITDFTVTTDGSKCVRMNPEDPDNYDFWDVAAGSQTFPCSATAAAELEHHYPPPDFTESDASGWTAPVSGEVAIETRQLNIALEAARLLRTDEVDDSVTKQLNSSVNIRNSRFWSF